MEVKMKDIRPAYNKAKKEFAVSWRRNNSSYSVGFNALFWKDFGAANNMEISIDRFEAGYPVISVLKFNSEKDYVWFILKWA